MRFEKLIYEAQLKITSILAEIIYSEKQLKNIKILLTI